MWWFLGKYFKTSTIFTRTGILWFMNNDLIYLLISACSSGFTHIIYLTFELRWFNYLVNTSLSRYNVFEARQLLTHKIFITTRIHVFYSRSRLVNIEPRSIQIGFLSVPITDPRSVGSIDNNCNNIVLYNTWDKPVQCYYNYVPCEWKTRTRHRQLP